MRYKIIKEFEVCGKQLYVVRVGNNVHIMDMKEIMRMYGSWHPERWNKNKGNKNKYGIA